MRRSLPRKLRSEVVAIFAPSAERISFSLADRTLIRYGSAHMLTAKARVLAALLQRLRQEGTAAAYIDVRVPSSPAIAPAAPSVTPSPSPSPTPTG
jgi:cell division septal protein FtsQ